MKKDKYGYLLGFQEADFKNINKAPNLTFDNPHSGYNFGATNFVCRKMAEQNENYGFLDTVKLLNTPDRNVAMEMMIDAFVMERTVVGEIPVNPDVSQFVLLNEVLFIARQTMEREDIDNKRMVIPLTLYSDQKETHGVALCVDADKEKKHADIMILEQHALRDGGILDYSQEIDKCLQHLSVVFKGIGFNSVETFQNSKPICREKRVCGIVSAEICRRLLNAEKPMELAKSGEIEISAEDVKKLHLNNYQAYTQENLSSSALKNQMKNFR